MEVEGLCRALGACCGRITLRRACRLGIRRIPWTEQAVRPFLARDDSTGDLLVGRARNQSRCQANVAAFGESTSTECVLRAPSPLENELLPLAVTRFDSRGVRQGTRILWPAPDAAEQVAFALAPGTES
ncbi:MAG TPA: hypothetical protein VJV79_34930 [Polyangiaceae bacterium]|nr:hypothetical protein [Polyangiaceae bacterium]